MDEKYKKYLASGLCESFHYHIEKLAISDRAIPKYVATDKIETQDFSDWEWQYKSSGKWNGYPPAKWKNYGYAIDGDTVQFINFKNKIKFSMDMHHLYAKLDNKKISFAGLLDGDLYGLATSTAGKIVRRYSGKNRYTGLAVRFDDRETKKWIDADGYWEHGQTVAECRAENKKKISLKKSESAWKEFSASPKFNRWERLVLRCVKNIKITRDDVANLSGACQSGIKSFLERNKLSNLNYIYAGDLIQLDPYNGFIRKTILKMAAAARKEKI